MSISDGEVDVDGKNGRRWNSARVRNWAVTGAAIVAIVAAISSAATIVGNHFAEDEELQEVRNTQNILLCRFENSVNAIRQFMETQATYSEYLRIKTYNIAEHVGALDKITPGDEQLQPGNLNKKWGELEVRRGNMLRALDTFYNIEACKTGDG